jgi:hypothetical protein
MKKYLGFDMDTGRKPRLRSGWIAGLLVAGSVATTGWLLTRYRLDTAATVVGLVGGVPGLAGLFLAWTAYRDGGRDAASSGVDLAGITNQLAVAVGHQWTGEAGLRRLNDPYPLPVRWEPADPALTDDWSALSRLARSGAGWPPASSATQALWASGPDQLAGGDAELVDVLGRVPTRRLAVLGEPGAGKTVLVVRLLLDLLARRTPGDPVPVLVSAASWNPTGEGFHAWLETRLATDHPSLALPAPPGASGSRVHALLDAGLILPIIDGLDEIPDTVRGPAIARINETLRPGEAFVITCRTSAYRHATNARDAAGVTLAGAAAVELRPLTFEHVATYLRDSAGGQSAAARWTPVLAFGSDQPPAETLTTPLMASLARIIYNPRPGELTSLLPDPAELCDATRFPTREVVELHLFDGFLAAAYRQHPDPAHRCPWPPEAARRWLAFLARHLEYTLCSTDLAWWQIPYAGSRRVLAWVCGLALALVLGVVLGLTGGLALGLAAGLAGGLTLGLAIMEKSGGRFGRRSVGLSFGVALGLAATFTVGLAFGLTAGIAGAVAGILWMDGRGEGTQEPSRGVRMRHTAVDLGVGLAFGVAVGLAGGLTVDTTFGVAVGLAAGLGGALVNGLRGVPEDTATAASPTATLVRDRRAALTVGLAGGLALGITVGLAAGLTLGVTPGLAAFFAGALSFGVMFVMFEVMWGWFMLARIWAALPPSRLPWRLMAFLADAHRRGVLRQAGAVYQFRHAELQRRLAR